MEVEITRTELWASSLLLSGSMDQSAVTQKIGHSRAILHRLGCIRPPVRPRHPQRDPEAQAQNKELR